MTASADLQVTVALWMMAASVWGTETATVLESQTVNAALQSWISTAAFSESLTETDTADAVGETVSRRVVETSMHIEDALLSYLAEVQVNEASLAFSAVQGVIKSLLAF